MSVSSYQKAQMITEDPRQIEYQAFAKVTGRLISARDSGSKGAELVNVLHDNKSLWQAFADACSVEGNKCTNEFRASIISMHLFIGRHAGLVIRGQASIDDLIEINKNVMEGYIAPKETDRRAA